MDDLDESALRAATVKVVDVLAKDAIFWGANPLKLWDQVATRIRSSARQSTSPQEWGSRMLRGLRVTTPSVASSQALTELAAAVGPSTKIASAWLQMVERETGFLIAEVRASREEKKAQREAERAASGEAEAPKARKGRAKKTEAAKPEPLPQAPQPAEESTSEDQLQKDMFA